MKFLIQIIWLKKQRLLTLLWVRELATLVNDLTGITDVDESG
jgi:hypothetical protein